MRILQVSLPAFLVITALGQQTPAQTRSPFVEVPAAAYDTLTFGPQLAKFEAADLGGRLWSSGRLQDRVTLVNIWAVWCLPCRAEHPEIQRFYEKVKDTKRIQVLTLSDDDPYEVEGYMKENKYTFPVIVNTALVQRLFSNVGGLPQTRVINQQLSTSGPFESWSLGRILYEVERLVSPIQK